MCHYKGPEPHGKTEDRAAAGKTSSPSAADLGGSVEGSVGGLHERRIEQRSVGAAGLVGAEFIVERQTAVWRHSERCAAAIHIRNLRTERGTTLEGRAVNITVRALHQPRRWQSAVRAIRRRPQSAKSYKSRKFAARGQSKNRAKIITGALFYCPVEIPILTLYQASERVESTSTSALCAKTVQRCQLPMGCDLEDRPATAAATHGTGSSEESSSVEISIPGLHQPRVGLPAIGAVRQGAEGIQRGKRALRSYFE